jgi:hypothetical protein
MTTNATARRLRRAAEVYAFHTWGMVIRKITNDEVLTMELRSDGYSNAHVEGEHESNGLCHFSGNMAARDCGEAGAAAEFVETTDGLARTDELAKAATLGSHAGHDHPATKAARAACRRAAAVTTTEEN